MGGIGEPKTAECCRIFRFPLVNEAQWLHTSFERRAPNKDRHRYRLDCLGKADRPFNHSCQKIRHQVAISR
jgi:hypothetical protein